MPKKYFKAAMVLIGVQFLSTTFSLPDNVQYFVNKMHDQYGFSKAALTKTLSQQKPNQSILKIEHRPYQHKPWPVFRDGLITKKRIHEGASFFRLHRQALLRAQRKYHVDPYVITAIIGFESTYGKNKGHYQALNSLYTLGFNYPKREKYFQKELCSLFLLARDWHKPVGSIKSSFDGGLGMPQFMPDMYRKMARAAKPKQFPDLINNPDDAIESVAYYLQQSHWDEKGFIARPIQLTASVMQPSCHYQKKANYSIASLEKDGFSVPKKTNNQKVGCVSLEDKETTDYWVIGNNFYAIQKYNPQIYYVLIVNQLSDSIKNQVHK